MTENQSVTGMRRMVLRGRLHIDGAVYTARGLELHHGAEAEIDLSGGKTVAWIGGEGHELQELQVVRG